mgnify:CR=1 FL=1
MTMIQLIACIGMIAGLFMVLLSLIHILTLPTILLV